MILNLQSLFLRASPEFLLISGQAFLDLIDCCEELSVATVMIAGDLLQGKGVYATEAADLAEPNLDYQVDTAENMLKMFPDCVKKIEVIMGNHEEKVKGKSR